MWAPKAWSSLNVSDSLVHEAIKHSQYSQGISAESKFFKSEKSYPVDRNDCDLVVNHKNVSHDHGQFRVVPGCRLLPLTNDVIQTVWCPTSAWVDGYR